MEKAIERLISNWKQLVNNGDFSYEEMRESLTVQVERSCQGWDSSLEELDSDPELYEMMGYDEDELTDEQMDEWTEVVCRAAQKYLEEV